jgi:threonine dehydrogenase-like Zn-dependent dehydrogenase
MKAAWLLGAGRVIAVDHLPYRLEKARAWANVETLNFREVDDVVTHLKKITEGGADVTIDCVGCEAAGSSLHKAMSLLRLQAGAPTAVFWCVETVKKGGCVSIVGAYGPPYNLFPLGQAMSKNLTLRMGQCNVKRYMPHLLEYIRHGVIDARGIISHRFPLAEAEHAYEIFAKKRDRCIKCVLIPDQA